ncbi:MAG: helix-turn-helix transcriptional regulator [Propionivibrio sp.]|uniref:Helix-turn-helix transcriptional regulator n=1 Tax=Candidatus Propionivibrio dominans TaxID=2954373 RepID=A0A9D7FL31_9RHOO|nr:helix-turn-helix transcriptional regulator [Candidatus Propionivibrio dominans]
MLKARSRAGLTQDAVAERMGATRSAASRLESAGKHAPSLATLKSGAPLTAAFGDVRTMSFKIRGVVSGDTTGLRRAADNSSDDH